ncbi:MAG: hypothetical protein GXY83_11710 [Rhodopirellula sp.]|nr:hypothetical protein [Rhodopirellula sp.]
MSASSRSAQYSNLGKILKKHYKPVLPPAERPVLETLLFGCCLENARYDAAEEAFAALVHSFFDFNEVRVSSVRELSEVMARLPDPAAAATRAKRILQDVFEATYSFELEEIRKQNLGPAVERLEKIGGATKFSVAYVVQAALGGHAIAVDSGTLGALHIVELVGDEDLSAGVVPGLERAIAKNKGAEFGSLLHQLGADFVANPYAPALHEILLQINPEAKRRLPKRRAAKAVETETKRKAGASAAAGAGAPSPSGSETSAEKQSAGTQRKRKAAAEKPAKRSKKSAEESASGEEPSATQRADRSAAEKPAEPLEEKKSGSAKPSAAKRKAKPSAAETSEKDSTASGLSKRKPR